MKPRNREINIFNMSLLDVLTGALGAFCFMTLSLFPYYKPSASGGGQGAAQLAQENAELRQRLKTFEMRRPLVFYASWTPRGYDVDLYVVDQSKTPKGQTAPEFVSDRKQDPFFPGDRRFGWDSSEIWFVRDNPEPNQYRIYYRLFDTKGGQEPCVVSGVILFQEAGEKSAQVDLPVVTLTRDRTGVLVGTLAIQPGGTFEFKSAIASAPSPQGPQPAPPSGPPGRAEPPAPQPPSSPARSTPRPGS